VHDPKTTPELNSDGGQGAGPGVAWRFTIRPLPGNTETPTIAIMVGPRPLERKQPLQRTSGVRPGSDPICSRDLIY